MTSAAAEGGASPEDDSCHVCQPFTKLVRDPSKFQACMKRAEAIGELGTPKSLYELIREDLEREDQEVFGVVCVDFRGQLRDYVQVSRGQRHRVATDVEDVLRVVLQSGCDGYAVFHNHPSGVAEPSDADEELTRAIMKGGEVACPNVHFLDHIVIGAGTEGKKGSWYSFAENGFRANGKVHEVT